MTDAFRETIKGLCEIKYITLDSNVEYIHSGYSWQICVRHFSEDKAKVWFPKKEAKK